MWQKQWPVYKFYYYFSALMLGAETTWPYLGWILAKFYRPCEEVGFMYLK